MKKNTRRSRQTPPARKTTHHIPIGLQIIARALGPERTVTDDQQLRAADVLALRCLQQPTSTDHDVSDMIDQLARTKEAEAIQNRIAATIPDSVTHDPHALITDLLVYWQDAAFALGLCLGFRAAASLSGKA